MFEKFFDSPSRIQSFRDSPWSSLLEGFANELYRTGYAKKTGRGRIRAAEYLLYWINLEGIEISSLTEKFLERFDRHIAQCQCPQYSCIYRVRLLIGARLFLKYLRSAGVITAPIIDSTDYDPVLFVEFCQWMHNQRGISESTLSQYSLPIRDLLKRFGEDPFRYEARSLREFVLQKSQQNGWGASKTCTTAIRMFLRFLIAEGKCAPGLDEAIPVLAHWRLSSIPRYLQPEEVERIIDTCDLNLSVGRRNRAILLLLSRLGLRAGDIVKLSLEDIDWEEAWLYVSGKGRRQARLPLTQEVGDAIADYIQFGRPQVENNTLFIRSRAPFCAFESTAAISFIVAQAMHRAGVTRPVRGAAHVLRHSVATSMLRQGASLQEIAAMLRHCSIETTQIYAKVDVSTLRQIAQPWPEVQPC